MTFSLAGVGVVHSNGKVALAAVTIRACAGERIAIIGPSGAGKTTLLRVLGAALRPTSGQVELLGLSPWTLGAPGLRRLRSRIGTVHQSAPLPLRQRVVTAVLAGRLGRWPLWKSLLSLVYPLDIPGARAALRQFDLDDRVFDRCDRISGGQLQRVGVARVIYQQPDLVLADEPVSSLDPTLALQTIRALAADASSRGATLVASLHAVDLALGEFPRIIGVRDGRIVFDLPREQVDPSRLHDLYAAEGAALPTLASDGRVVAASSAPRPHAGAGLPHP
ncbi:MAG: phosphonate ABC transporter ATP-binding protein [Burkholderiaceae bacterium]|nr:phosphonate ABC transporter ATP-binding protein [Burkholderiaceae bacterium]